jgi:predicted TIM-barrel enzyme
MCKMRGSSAIDLIVIYNSGRYQRAGRGSPARLMPYVDANLIVIEVTGEVLSVAKHIRFSRACHSDPFRMMDEFLYQVKTVGFSDIQNFTTVGLIYVNFRDNLEDTGNDLSA